MQAANNPTPNALKDIVIIGDGPTALVMAIKLKQAGVKHVTLVGPRLGIYARSGDTVKQAFEAVNASIKPLKITITNSRQLKEIERQLYELVKSLNINLVKKKFVGFSADKFIEVADPDNQAKERLHADLLFDCTGTKREVITQFNARAESGLRFDIAQAGKLPARRWAFTRIMADRTDFTFSNSHIDRDPVRFVECIKRLREVGWKEDALPHIYGNPIFTSSGDQKKLNVYFTVPEDANEEQIKAYFPELISMHRANAQTVYQPQYLHPSSKHTHKKNLYIFNIDTKTVNPPCFEGDQHYPFIIHLGDATANLPFISGSSLYSGLGLLREKMESFSVNQQGEISIDVAKLIFAHADGMGAYQFRLAYAEEHEKEVSEKRADKEQLLVFYQMAALEAGNGPKSALVNSELHRLELILLAQLLQEVRKSLVEQANQALQAGFKFTNMLYDRHFNEAVKKIKSITKFQTITDSDKAELLTVVKEMAETSKKMGAAYFTREPPNYALAAQSYRAGIKLFDDFDPKNKDSL